jgi:hypothetical protein
MTLREFIDKAKEIADEAGEESYSVQVEYWHYTSDREAISYQIWSSAQRRHADGPTPEVCLVNWQAMLRPTMNIDAITDIEAKAVAYGEGM